MPIFWRPASIHYWRPILLMPLRSFQMNKPNLCHESAPNGRLRSEEMEVLNDYAEIYYPQEPSRIQR